jgi:hypothetical protein
MVQNHDTRCNPLLLYKIQTDVQKLHLLHTDAANFKIQDSEEEIKLQTRH